MNFQFTTEEEDDAFVHVAMVQQLMAPTVAFSAPVAVTSSSVSGEGGAAVVREGGGRSDRAGGTLWRRRSLLDPRRNPQLVLAIARRAALHEAEREEGNVAPGCVRKAAPSL